MFMTLDNILNITITCSNWGPWCVVAPVDVWLPADDVDVQAEARRQVQEAAEVARGAILYPQSPFGRRPSHASERANGFVMADYTYIHTMYMKDIITYTRPSERGQWVYRSGVLYGSSH